MKKVGERLNFHLSFMALMMATGRDDMAQESFKKALLITEDLKEGREVNLNPDLLPDILQR